MPYIARHKESELTSLETSAQNYRLHQEALQKHIKGTTPEHTSLVKRISKDFLVPFSRHRITNELLRKIRLLGRVQKVRVALMNDDLARCLRVEREWQNWRWWYTMAELQRMGDSGGGEFYFEVAGFDF